MDPLISSFQSSLQSIVLRLKEDLKTIRTGRANPAILENLIVDAYAGQTKLKLLELSTITTEGPANIIVLPFDPSTIKDIETAILKSPLGFSPQTQGTRIIVRLPALSQEQREKFTKLVSQMIEDKKTQVRNERDEVRKKIKQDFEAKIVTEDQKFRLEKDIDSMTQKYNLEIQQIKESKEKEIMAI